MIDSTTGETGAPTNGRPENGRASAALEVMESSRAFVVGRYQVTPSPRTGADVVTRGPAQPSVQRRDHPAVFVAPDEPLIGRERELSFLTDLARKTGIIEVTGADGLGKSILLRRMLDQAPVRQFEAVLYLHGAGSTSGDLLVQIFSVLYDTDQFVPNQALLERYLKSRHLLVVIDEFDGSAETARAFVEALPGSTMFFAAPAARLGGIANEVKIVPLMAPDAYALLNAAVAVEGEPPRDPALDTELIASAAGNPLELIRAIAIEHAPCEGRDDLVALSRAAARQHGTRTLAFAATSEQERCVLAALVTANGAPLDAEAIRNISEPGDADDAIATLVERRLIDSDGTLYWIRPPDLPLAFATAHDFDRFQKASEYFEAWSTSAPAQDIVVLRAEAIVRNVALSLAKGRLRDVVAIGRPFSDLMLEVGMLGRWGLMLECVLEAARRLKDRTTESWALHQIGVRALCIDDHRAARVALQKALRIRRASRDSLAAEVTARVLALVEIPKTGSIDSWLRERFQALAAKDRRGFALAAVTGLCGIVFAGMLWLTVARFHSDARGRVAHVKHHPRHVVRARGTHGQAAVVAQQQTPASPAPVHHILGPDDRLVQDMTAQDAAIAAQAAEEGGGNGGSQNIPAHTIRADVAPPPHQRLRIADPPVAAAAPPSRIDPLPLAGSAAGDPQILSFYAEPALVTVGEIARLCFNVRNADSASIEYVGAVSVGGPACVNVAPHETQTYTLEVVGNYKLYRAYASVAVSQPNAGLSQHLGSGSASTYARRLTQQ